MKDKKLVFLLTVAHVSVATHWRESVSAIPDTAVRDANDITAA